MEGRAQQIWRDLQPTPGRFAATIRITVGVLVLVSVMLAFRMPFLDIGPYFIFTLMQREMLTSRAAAVLSLLGVALACLLIYLLTLLTWDVASLRILFATAILFTGFFLMQVFVEPRFILMGMLILAVMLPSLDRSPFPNLVVGELGWLWALIGTAICVSLTIQWLMRTPMAIERMRWEFRRFFTSMERRCVARAFGRAVPEGSHGHMEGVIELTHLLAKFHVLTPAQAGNTRGLLSAAREVGTEARRAGITGAREAWLALGRRLRVVRTRVRSGQTIAFDGIPEPVFPDGEEESRRASERLTGAVQALSHTNEAVPRASAIRADWLSNPAHTDFALRATAATMGCYFFMKLSNWDGIHTCMITCIATASASVDQQVARQNLRLVGAVIGGFLGIVAVVWFIPRFEGLAGLYVVLAVGSAVSAWVALASPRIAYAGLQIALAFFITTLQHPYPNVKLDPISDRWVGILVGILAMRAAFDWLAPKARRVG